MSKTEETQSRVYTINLGKAWLTPRYRRTDRVMNMVREFAVKNMKSDEVKIDQDLSRHIWARGRTNPPRKVRVKMVKDEDDIVTVSLYEEAVEEVSEEEEREEEEDTEKEKSHSKKAKKEEEEENENKT